MNQSRRPLAFTLIELLVVIAIIAILAAVAMPVYGGVTMRGRQIAAMNSARQIGIGLRMYASDYDGIYPVKKNTYDQDITTSNDAFRSLIPNYIDTEKVFAVAGSKAGPSADNQMSDTSNMLAKGENHWAYISGLSSTSNSNWPLLVDHTDGTGSYTTQEGALGGTWKGTKAVVVNADTSAHIQTLLGNGTQRYLPRYDDKTKNALQVSDYMGDSAKLLEPEQ